MAAASGTLGRGVSRPYQGKRDRQGRVIDGQAATTIRSPLFDLDFIKRQEYPVSSAVLLVAVGRVIVRSV